MIQEVARTMSLATLWKRITGQTDAATPPSIEHSFAAVGYPKVGNTWLRFMLGRYLALAYGLAETPLLDRGDLPALAAAGCRARGEFTHVPLEWQTQTANDLTRSNVVEPFAGTSVVLLVRHPLDTLVSFYMQDRFRRGGGGPEDLAEFVVDPIFGLDKYLRFYQLWDSAFDTLRHVCLWRYEDARRAPRESLIALLNYLGEPVVDVHLDAAVAAADFNSMQALERSGTPPVYKSSGFSIFATGDAANPDALHVRKGKVGGYRDELPAALVATLEARVAREMPTRFGYGDSRP